MGEYIKGIDVSRWQGKINWEAVRADGIFFAFVKAGGSDCGFYTDPYFVENIQGAHAAGIRVGAYWYVGAKCVTYDDGFADGERMADICSAFRDILDLPIIIDFEAPPIRDKAGNTAAVRGFCAAVSASGFVPGVYASEISGFRDRLNLAALPDIFKWCAKWSAASPNSLDWSVWQQTSEGRVDGIAGAVDIDYFKPEAWEAAAVSDQNKFKEALADLRRAIEKVEALL